MIDVFQLLGVGAVFLALEFDGVPVRGGRMTDRTILARGSESLGVFVMQKHGGRHFQLLELALWHRCGSRRDGFGRPATVKQTTQSHPNRSRQSPPAQSHAAVFDRFPWWQSFANRKRNISPDNKTSLIAVCAYALRQVPSFSSWYREKKSPSRGECLTDAP